MSPDGNWPHEGQDDRAGGGPSVPDTCLSPGAPLTALDLCGRAMVVVGMGMPLAVAFPGWVWMGPGSMLILILFMGMAQERWLTRERHRLFMSALKRTGTLSGSPEGPETPPHRTRARGGGKPEEDGVSREPTAGPRRLEHGGVARGEGGSEACGCAGCAHGDLQSS